ncbi:DUF3857 domain-containing transglutaminase family protein [Taibaiella koreensis]|uniref:DUF3857 domain-containing transglutaminase family protein n=1 Tax=Taibaiella koreensis TaxID=1268548 RepID=UPI000E59A4BC|nr:DUF3857 and transglutaminase domain-containing protein [Taibaiella koreensis]
MKSFTTIALLLLASFCCPAKEAPAPDLATSGLPDSLKKNAHAIIRYDNTSVKIKALDEVIHTRKYAVTILDEAGKGYAVLREQYNLLVKIEKIKGRLLDAAGKEIRSLKEKEIVDRSTFGQSFVYHSDSRIKYFDFQHTTYPYTVEYEIEETYKTTFFLPGWMPQPDNDCAIENAECTVYYPSDLNISYQEFLMPANIARSTNTDGDQKSITWKIKQLPAYERQPASRIGNYEDPTIVFTANRFELLKYKGDMQNWQSFGSFFYQLNEGRDVLPDEARAKVHALVDGETDTYNKIQKLYAYMQQTTRYVANEYGIAGWQTFDAASVAKNGYGDCKGLTNYLKAMLKEAGIPAYTTLVYAGEQHRKMDLEHPANTFNHVILCVPQPKDSIWVECTSQQLPAGYLGGFTQGRKVLVVTENGGYVCTTPTYDKDKNYIQRTATLQLDQAASQQKVNLRCRYSGPMQDDIDNMVKTQPEHKIRELVNSKFAFPSYSATNYQYHQIGAPRLPGLEEDVEAQVAGIISSTKKRSFVNIAWMRNPMPEIFQSKPRTVPFVLAQSFRVTDSIIVDLPADLEVETLPRPTSLKYPFAEYHVRLEKAGSKMSLIRIYEQNEGVYSAADFEKYQEMYRTINAEKENLNIVLLNKTP